MKRLKKDEFNTQFMEANSIFVMAQKVNASFPPLWLNWAYLKYYEEDYVKAFEFMNKAKAVGCKVPEKFITDLNQKMKD